MAEKDAQKTEENKLSTCETKTSSDVDTNLENDPILGGSSINSEDYWFLKLSGLNQDNENS